MTAIISKATLRIPTDEQYAYVEIDVTGTPSEILEQYNTLTGLVKANDGLPVKEWNAIVDAYLLGNGMTVDGHEGMGKAQVWFIHELDKAFGRLKAKEAKLNTNEM